MCPGKGSRGLRHRAESLLMKVNVNGFKLEIDLCDLVESLNKEDHLTLARLVAADEQLFAGVLECVSSSGMLGHYFEDDPSGSWWFDDRALLSLREKLIPLMPEIARGAVRAALQQRNQAQQDAREKDVAFWRIYHAWPTDRSCPSPPLPRGYSRAPNPTESEITSLFSDSSSQPDAHGAAPGSRESSPQSPSGEPT